MKSKFFLFLLLICSFRTLGFSQETQLDSVLNEVLFDDEDFIELVSSSQNFQFLYTRMNYDSKTYFAGRDIGFQQYNMTGQIAYFHSIGINLGAAAVYYSAMDPKISTFVLMGGYNGKLFGSSDYRYRVSYDRYFFPQSEVLSASSFNSSISGGFTIDKKIAGTRLDYSLLMGKEYGSQVSWDLYGDITVYKFGKFNRIKFEPELSLYFGTDQTIITQLGIIPGRFPSQYELTEIQREKFGWMNTELKLPVTLSLGDFDFELGYNLNFPRLVIDSEKLQTTSYLNFSIGYLISL